MSIAPAVTETFTGLNVHGTWHGPAPRLATADEFGSYADVRQVDEFSYVGVRAAPLSVPVPWMDLSIQVTNPTGLVYAGMYLFEDDGTADGGDFYADVAWPLTELAPGEWYTNTWRITAGVDYDAAAVEASLAAGTLILVGDSSGAGQTAGTPFYYSQIRMVIGVDDQRPLRQHPLDEGHGATPRRYGGRSASKSLSGNHNGYQ